MKNLSCTSAAVAGLLFAAPAFAQQTAPGRGAPPPLALMNIGMDRFRETYLASLLGPLRTAAVGGSALTAEDVQLSRQVIIANARGHALGTFFSNDLNDDGQVTLPEYLAANARSPYASFSTKDVFTKQFRELDLDSNGIVTFEEAKAVPNHVEKSFDFQRTENLVQLLALDPNQDGRLTPDELEQLGRVAFAFYDRNDDGVLSTAEAERLDKDRRAATAQRDQNEEVSKCMFPRAAGGEDVFLIDAFSAAALSNVSLLGETFTTQTAEIFIEPGETPLYIVAFGRWPIIWRLTGDTKRVTQFVAMSNASAVGVTGLAESVITLKSNENCLRDHLSATGVAARQTGTAFERSIGRPLRGIVYGILLKTALPSGAIAPAQMPAGPTSPVRAFPPNPLPPPPTGIDEDTNRRLWRKYPGGVVQIDPSQVIASKPAKPYLMLPSEAGLMTLLLDGSISATGNNTYRINRPIPHFPIGMDGARDLIYTMAPGVPRPPSVWDKPANVQQGGQTDISRP